ncbi:MAG TPA: YggS family pyridoxal phosphate-dependent enzyme [Pseudoclavibacter sp.]|nr:YggS family pyridoxal phosphate-dependent enzyme [Pseudoclavibacter sp.]
MAAPTEQSQNIVAALDDVRARIQQAEAEAGRAPGSVRLLPVSKTFPASAVEAAMSAGCTRFGENKVQEALHKFEELGADPEHPEWAIIGHLQTNKAKYVARFATEFQALDSVEIAQALQHRLELEQRTLDVLIQVNTSGEQSKSGVDPDHALDLLAPVTACDRLALRGFMTIATNTDGQDEIRRCFRQLRQIRDRAQDVVGRELPELSMGMSADFPLAIAEGASVVRVGSAIFGARHYPTQAPNMGA